jgi:integrase
MIARHADLNNPESVKKYISIAKNTKTEQPVEDETKCKMVWSYNKYCQINGITWTKPHYKVAEKTPTIPTRENVEAIINNASKRYITIFTLLKETGASGMELSNVKQQDIDLEQKQITIKGCKGHASATYKLKTQTAELLRVYIYANPQEHPFPSSRSISQVWLDTRKRASIKLCKSELRKVKLQNLRNFSGAELYKSLPIRDPIAVMRHLRHKKLDTTMHYLRAITLDYEEDDQWITRTSTTIEEDAKLIEAGFQYVTERDRTKLFRKRK